jgi:putative OPT family oligopeptide transporter
VVKGVRGGESAGPVGADAPRTDRDIPAWIVVVVPILVIVALIAIPGLLAGNMPLPARTVAAIGVAIFGVCFVVVSSRIVGLIGVSSNPTSAMTLVTLLGVSIVFVLMGWRDPSARAAILTVGTVVCIAASKAGDISQDLKTGYLVGATPARQQYGQFIAAAIACWAVAAVVLSLGQQYTFGSPDLPAPQATLMKTVIEGVLAGSLPWGLVGTGASMAVCALIAGLPGLSFAVGIYLPLGTLAPVFVGGIVRRLAESKEKDKDEKKSAGNSGLLAASGMIAGEGLAGVAIAFLAGAGIGAKKGFTYVAGMPGTILGIVTVLAVCALLFKAGRREMNRD